MSVLRTLAGTLLLIALAAAPARADGLIIPFFGVNYGGDSGKSFSDAYDSNRWAWGASFAFMGSGVFGAEGDFAYSPDFFGKTDLGGSKVLTAMGNLLVGIPFGGQRGFGLRPYGVFGVGLIHSGASLTGISNLDESSFSWDSGGGLMVFFSTHAGMRFDIRYLRTFDALKLLDVQLVESSEKLDFTRTSLGLILRF